MTDEEIVQDLIEVAEEALQEEDEEVTDETIMKPTTKEICTLSIFQCLIRVAKFIPRHRRQNVRSNFYIWFCHLYFI